MISSDIVRGLGLGKTGSNGVGVGGMFGTKSPNPLLELCIGNSRGQISNRRVSFLVLV